MMYTDLQMPGNLRIHFILLLLMCFNLSPVVKVYDFIIYYSVAFFIL